MTEDEIKNAIAYLDRFLGTWHEQVNDIAALEAAGAIASHPLPYTNPQLTAAKDRLVHRSAQAITAMQNLHLKLVSGGADDSVGVS